MWNTNIDLNVDDASIDPRFLLRVDFEYYENLEAPITFHGFIKSIDGKKIATLDCEYKDYGSKSIAIPMINSYKNANNIHRNKERKYSMNFSAQISSKSIDYLETQRLTRNSKNVLLNIELEIITLKFENAEKQELKIERNFETRQVEIEQSIWLKKYSSRFGIGEFLLIEFPKQNITIDNKIKNNWVEKIQRSQIRLKDMDSHLSEGKWEKVIETSRKIWDIFKLYKDNDNLKEEFKDLFEKNNYSDSGLEDFIKSIWHLHDFASKFMHDKDKKGETLNPIVIAQKEDAYFMYLWAMGFINLLNEKVKGLK